MTSKDWHIFKIACFATLTVDALLWLALTAWADHQLLGAVVDLLTHLSRS